MCMAALQDVDAELQLQSFYRHGGVLFDNVDEIRKSIFYFQYPELVLIVIDEGDTKNKNLRESLLARLTAMKERVKTVVRPEVFPGLSPSGLGAKAKVEFDMYIEPTKLTVHASFSSADAMDMAAVQAAVNNAGFVWTTHHQGQQENWFDVWRAKAEAAAYIIVIFCKGYRSRFTPALKQEADCIQQLHEQETPVYVFNSEGERGHRTAEIESNLRQGAKHMGNYGEWTSFVSATAPREPAAAEAEAGGGGGGGVEGGGGGGGTNAAAAIAIAIGDWLTSIHPALAAYEQTLIDEGYDDTGLLPTMDDTATHDEILQALDTGEPPIKAGHRRKIQSALRAL